MQIPILNGVYTGENADYRTLYPYNMMPVIQDTGISQGYLRPVDGITELSEGLYVSRGALNWNGVEYRVMGQFLYSVASDGTLTRIGSVGNDNSPVTMTYSFEIMAIASNSNLFYYYPTTVDDASWTYTQIAEADGFRLVQVTDEDLGVVETVTWVDGYFMTTDGASLVVTELTDPTTILTTKYGSSEIDPDPVENLHKLRNEIYAVNRYTIEIFDNIGGTGFPFQRIEGAQIHKGSLGRHCSAVFQESIAFLGGGKGERPGVYVGVNATAPKISTREIDDILGEYTEAELSTVVMETLNNKSQSFLWIRLPNITLVYDGTASQQVGEHVWHTMGSGTTRDTAYRARDIIYCYDQWRVADTQSGKLGYLNDNIATQFGEKTTWEFGTKIIYNNSMGALVHSLELVVLTGRSDSTEEPIITTSYSKDGRLWSQERQIRAGAYGNRIKRLVWRRQGNMSSIRIQRFRGDSDTYIAISRLEAQIEALNR